MRVFPRPRRARRANAEAASDNFEETWRIVREGVADREARHPLGQPFVIDALSVTLFVIPAGHRKYPHGSVRVSQSCRGGSWSTELVSRQSPMTPALKTGLHALVPSYFVSFRPDLPKMTVAAAFTSDPEIATLFEVAEWSLDDKEVESLVVKPRFLIPDLATAMALSMAIERAGLSMRLRVEDSVA